MLVGLWLCSLPRISVLSDSVLLVPTLSPAQKGNKLHQKRHEEVGWKCEPSLHLPGAREMASWCSDRTGMCP